MKRLSAFFFLLIALNLSGQTVIQNGFVRTVGRPDNRAGVRLPDAVIRVTGSHNSVASDGQGEFSILFPGARAGIDSYSIGSVSLVGYEVNDKDLLGRRLPISPSVPQEIVMISYKDKQAIEDKVRKQVEARYQERLRKIQSERDSLGTAYGKALLELEALYEKRDMLVHDMVERYASTDYAKLDSTAARINAYIENGELEKADSALNAINVRELEIERMSLVRNIERKQEELEQEKVSKARIDESLYSAYNAKFDIFCARVELDSALVCLKKIVALDTLNVSNLCALGVYLEEYLSKYDEARSCYEKALALVGIMEGARSKRCAELIDMIGKTYNGTGHYDEAEAYFKKALAIREKLGKDSAVELGKSYDCMASLSANRGQYDDAIKYEEKALRLFLESYGEDDAHVKDCYNNLGCHYSSIGEYRKSVEAHKKSLELSLKICGPEDKKTGIIYNNLGVIYFKIGELKSAEECLMRAMRILEANYGRNSGSVAVALGNVGQIYEELGYYDRALSLDEEALDINRKIYGEVHPATAIVYNNMSSVYFEKGEFEKSLSYAEKVLEIRVALYGKNHQDVASAYNSIGTVYTNMNRYDDAISNLEKAVSILDDVPCSRIAKATVKTNLADVYQAVGEYDKALEIYKESLKLKMDVLGEGNAQIATLYNNMAALYGKQKNYEREIELHNKALSIRLALFGEKHPEVALSYNNLGVAYGLSGNYKMAEKYLRKTLDLRKILFGSGPKLAAIYSNLAFLYMKMSKRQIAIDCIEHCIEESKGYISENTPQFRGMYQTMARLYEEMDNVDQARKYYERALEIAVAISGENSDKAKEIKARLNALEK